MTEEKTKQNEKVENDQFTVEAITLSPVTGSVDEIEKVSFHTNKGKITWKPKVKKLENISGFQVERLKPMIIGELPDTVKLMNTQVRDHGKVFVVGSYLIYNKDGERFKYLVSDMVKEWKFSVESFVSEEKVI